jgi:hypothetical protein
MNVADLLSVFRNIADDSAEPYFWSDDTFYVYLSDAINQYCRYGRPVTDHTSALCSVNYEKDDPWVVYDERILKVVSAYDVDNSNKPLRITDWEDYNRNGVAPYPNTTGDVNALLTGMEDQRMRVLNIPVVDGTIKMVIHRLPLKSISVDYDKIESVPITDRLMLLDWVMYRAYNHEDAEMFDPKKAASSKVNFMNEVYKVRSADMKRTSKNWVAGYGG